MRDAARDWAQQAAAPREARRGRDDRRETFGRNVGGTAEPSTPLHRRGAQGGGAAPAVAMPNGRHLRTELPGQTWDGNRLDLGTPILDAGWSDHSPVSGPSTRWTMPAGGSYWDYDVELEIGGTAAESGQAVDITLKVDGEPRRVWTDVWVTDNLHLKYRIGTLDRGSAVTLEHTGGDPLTVLWGQSSMQLVDRQVGETVEPDAPIPVAKSVDDDTDSGGSGTLTVSTAELDVTAGDRLMFQAMIYNQFASNPQMSAPSGVDVLVQRDITSDTQVMTFTKIADSTDAGAGRTYEVPWTVPSSSAGHCHLLLAVLDGAVFGGSPMAVGDEHWSGTSSVDQTVVVPSTGQIAVVIQSKTDTANTFVPGPFPWPENVVDLEAKSGNVQGRNGRSGMAACDPGETVTVEVNGRRHWLGAFTVGS